MGDGRHMGDGCQMPEEDEEAADDDVTLEKTPGYMYNS